MADDIQKKVLLDVQLAQSNASSDMAALATAVGELATSVKELQNITKTAQTNISEYTEKLNKSKLTAQQNREEITRLNLARRQEADAVNKTKTAITAAKGSYDEAQKSLTAMGRAIKSAENGFKSTDPAIQKQIASYKKLNTELGAFDAKMGNHQRNVGNYTSALSGFSQALNNIIPGFSQFSSILTGAARGFSAMGSSATQAGSDGEAAMGGLASSMGPVVVGIVAVIAATAAEITYLLQFQKYSDGLSKTWAGIKGSTEGFMTYVNNNNEKLDDNFEQFKQHWADFFHSIGLGYKEASTAQGLILDLARQSKNAATLTADEDMRVQLLIKDIRDRTTSATQAQKDYNEVLQINGGQYQRNHGLAVQMFDSEVKAAAAGLNLTKEQIKSITDLSLGYEKLTENAKKLLDQQEIGKDFLDDYNKGLQSIIAVDNKKAQSDEMAKLRDDMKQSRANAAAEKEKQLQEEIARATEAANSEMLASTTKMLLSQQEAFGRSISETEEKARQSIFKLQQEIEKNQAIANDKRHTAKTRNAAEGLVKAATKDQNEIRKANYLEIQQMAVDHNRQMIEIAAKGALDLKAVEIQGIQNLHKRELATIENNYQEKLLTLKNENQTIQDTINKLDKEIGSEKDPIALQALKTTLNEQQALLGNNADLVAAYEKQKQQAIEETIRKYENEKQLNIDETSTLRQKGIQSQSGTNNKEVLAAEQKQLLDQYAFDVSAKGLTDEKKLELEQKYLNDKAALDQQYAKKQKDYDIQISQQVEDAAFKIIEQSLAHQAQANEVFMERQKEHDLQNTALTASQKYIVEEKYRVQEGQAKVKQFHQEQEIALAKAAIDTAAAIIKAAPIVPLEVLAAATGALEMGVIASERAPAYAKGGQFVSDGKGAVLPGYSKTDNVNAHLRSGEAVVVSEAMRDPWAKSVVSAINQAYGGRAFSATVPVSWQKPGFASGGVFNSYLPTGDNGLRPQINIGNNRMHPDDINGIAQAVANIKFPAPIMDIKDVNYQQGKLATATDRLTY